MSRRSLLPCAAGVQENARCDERDEDRREADTAEEVEEEEDEQEVGRRGAPRHWGDILGGMTGCGMGICGEKLDEKEKKKYN